MRSSQASVAVMATALVGFGLLTGCAQQSIVDTCTPTYGSGAVSENVTVLGTFGTEPTVSIAEGFTYNSAQAHFLEKAEDRTNAVTSPALVSINYMIVASGTNEVIAQSSSFSNGQGNDVVAVSPGSQQSVFPAGLECAAPGDRLVLTLSPEEVFAITGVANSEEQPAYAIVVDVHNVQPMSVDGRVQTLPAGFPSIVVNEHGQPGVVSTPNDPPTDTRAATRIMGDGAVITDDTYVVANVLQVSWDGWRTSGNRQTREPIMNTFTSGPVDLGSTEAAQYSIREALTGFTVGSQVVVIVPDEQHGAVVSVVDILAGV